jgi:hypothetical protein
MVQAGERFEQLVLAFCKRKWPVQYVKENRKIDGRELDIVIDSPSELIFIECTTDKTKKKAEHDITKIRDSRRILVGDYSQRPVTGYYVTPHPPSPDVHKVADENGTWISACSFPAFMNKFNAGSMYVTERKNHPFGSVRNPADDDIAITRQQYVPVPFPVIASSKEYTIEKIVSALLDDTRVRLLLTGDFGLGKSMTFRELFFQLAEKFEAGELCRFPMYINLRDGSFDTADDAVDLIERHARWVGMRDYRDNLVQAWKSDCCILLLDGFDEIARSGFDLVTISSEHFRLTSSRIIKELIKQSPSTPILICGRQSYFDNFEEMKVALGAEYFEHASLSDFNHAEVKELYTKILGDGQEPIVFGWLPQRPLLLSYLYFMFQDNLRELRQESGGVAPGEGWNRLLDRLGAREIEVARNAHPKQIRELIERVGVYARGNVADYGKVTDVQVNQAFRDVAEMEPVEAVKQVLMRLPGLNPGGGMIGNRSFIENTFFEAAQAGTIVELIEALATRDLKQLRTDHIRPIIDLMRKTHCVITSLTAQVVIAALKSRNTLSCLGTALQEGLVNDQINVGNVTGDLFKCALELPEIGFKSELTSIVLNGAYFTELDLTSEVVGSRTISFHDCIIEKLNLDIDHSLLKNLEFERTHVKELNCSEQIFALLQNTNHIIDVSKKRLFDEENSSILEETIPRRYKAMKILLLKLFRQHYAGIPKSALFRGVGTIQPDFIEACLHTLVQQQIAYVVGSPTSKSSMWYPNKAYSDRADRLINATGGFEEILIEVPEDVE